MMLALAVLLRMEGPHALWLLALLMLLVGAGSALMDVSINAEGSQLETASGVKVMSGFHAMFSTGGMAGAAAGAALSFTNWAPATQLTMIGLALAVAIIVTSRHMLATPPVVEQERSGFNLPRGRLLLLGLLCAVGMLSEGAMYDWSVLYLEQDLHSSHVQAALAFASFSAAMAIGRFGGDALRERFAPAPLLACSALLSALAMALVLAAGQPLAALVGFAFVGFGMANLVPILVMAASQAPGVAPSAAIAVVSALGYLGFVGGPPLIGAIAQAASLGAALVVIVIACLTVAWGARRL
jgi:fucose permease